jgi:colanic acid biosynthesis glycosyl transferase WcaI
VIEGTGLRDCRLVFVNRFFHPDHSATSQILSDLAFGLVQRTGRIEVLASRLSYEGKGVQLPRRERHAGVEIHRVRSTSFGRMSTLGRVADYLSFLGSMRRALSGLAGPDSIIVAKTDPPLLGSFAIGPALARGACFVNWIQDVFPEVAERAGVPYVGGPLAAKLRALRNNTLARAAATVVIGEDMARTLVATGQVARDSVHVIPNWADGVAIRPMPAESSTLRADWGLEGKFVVGYSGNMGRVHEFGTVIDAAEVLRDNQQVRFMFVGAGRQQEALRDEVQRRRLGNVVFAPYQPRERLAESLSVPDVHLCTLDPRFEGLVVPSKVYGIMAAGRPCVFVGAPEGEVARLVRRGQFGTVVSPGNGALLAREIESMRQRPAVRAQHGRNARRLFEAEFDLPVAVARWASLLEAVWAGHRSRLREGGGRS